MYFCIWHGYSWRVKIQNWDLKLGPMPETHVQKSFFWLFKIIIAIKKFPITFFYFITLTNGKNFSCKLPKNSLWQTEVVEWEAQEKENRDVQENTNLNQIQRYWLHAKHSSSSQQQQKSKSAYLPTQKDLLSKKFKWCCGAKYF